MWNSASLKMEETAIEVEHLELLMKIMDLYTDREIPDEEFLENTFREQGVSVEAQPVVAEMFFGWLIHEQLVNSIADTFHKWYHRKELADTTMLRVMGTVCLLHLGRRSWRSSAYALSELHALKAWRLLRMLTARGGLAQLVAGACAAELYTPDELRALLYHLEEPDQTGPAARDYLYQTLVERHRFHRKPPTIPVAPSLLNRPRVKPPATPPNTPAEEPRPCAAPAPPSTWRAPREQQLLAERRAANREAAQRLLSSAQRAAFRCAQDSKSERYWRRLEQLQAEQQQQRAAQRPRPVSKTAKVPVKMNAATILREGSRFLKEEEQQIKTLRDLAAGRVNPNEVERLLSEDAQWREQQQLAEIARKHLEGLLTREEAALAKQQLVEHHKEMRQHFDREREELYSLLEKMRAEDEERARQLVEKGQAASLAAREAVQHLQQQRQRMVQEMNEESKAMLEEALQRRREEMARRMELIQEVRALQQMKAACTAAAAGSRFDESSTAGVGLLCEMSVAELRERLQLLRHDVEEELRRRQERASEQRRRHQQLLCDTSAFVRQRREELRGQQAARSGDQKSQKIEIQVPETEELQTLKKKLEEKRELRKKFQQDAKNQQQSSVSITTVKSQSKQSIQSVKSQ